MQPDIAEITVPASETPPIPAHRVRVYAWGKAEQTPLLCVHGLTRNGRDFDYIAERLAGDFYVLCPDMAGRGDSDILPAEYYNYETYIAEIECLLARKNLTRIHWLGTSMGGILAMLMANRRPGLIASLILNDVGTLIPVAGLSRILSYAGVQMEFATRQQAEQHLRSIWIPFGILREEHWQHLFQYGIQQEKDGRCHLRYDPAITASLAAGTLNDIDLSALWEAVKSIPTLLIRGENSDILTEQTAHAMAESHPQLTRYNIANTGHAPMLMAEEQIQTIADWLRKNA